MIIYACQWRPRPFAAGSFLSPPGLDGLAGFFIGIGGRRAAVVGDCATTYPAVTVQAMGARSPGGGVRGRGRAKVLRPRLALPCRCGSSLLGVETL